MIRDRDSVLRGYRRELASAKGDNEREAAIREEIKRVEALPPAPAASGQGATPAERESARITALLDALKRELERAVRAADGRAKDIEAEIKRVEALLHIGVEAKTERVRTVPKAEHATADPD